MTSSALNRTGIPHGWNNILKDSHKHWAGAITPLLRNGQLQVLSKVAMREAQGWGLLLLLSPSSQTGRASHQMS